VGSITFHSLEYFKRTGVLKPSDCLLMAAVTKELTPVPPLGTGVIEFIDAHSEARKKSMSTRRSILWRHFPGAAELPLLGSAATLITIGRPDTYGGKRADAAGRARKQKRTPPVPCVTVPLNLLETVGTR